ncbi:hypothetical protein KA107_01680 [Candidatus Pacearchaeota archaeon]|nr:hypothetical protein [Candidatus Pacearchaeota archaeon]
MVEETGLVLKTRQTAGRWIHEPFDKGVAERRPIGDWYDSVKIPDEVVALLQQVNEKMFDLMPNGSQGLEIQIKYTLPEKPASS